MQLIEKGGLSIEEAMAVMAPDRRPPWRQERPRGPASSSLPSTSAPASAPAAPFPLSDINQPDPCLTVSSPRRVSAQDLTLDEELALMLQLDEMGGLDQNAYASSAAGPSSIHIPSSPPPDVLHEELYGGQPEDPDAEWNAALGAAEEAEALDTAIKESFNEFKPASRPVSERSLKTGIKEAVITSLRSGVLNGEKSCAICLSPYKLQQKIVSLHCGHVFHNSCCGPWFKENDSCPLCKKPV